MIFRGCRLSHLRQHCPAFRHRGPLPFYAERVPSPFSAFLGHFTSGSGDHGSDITPIGRRNYAGRPVSRPKAHTGKTTAAPSKKAATTTEITVKTTSTRGKKSPTKPKPKPETKAKTASRTKAKAKPKRRTRTKKILTEAQKEKLAARKAKREAKLAATKAKRKEKLAAQKSRQEIADFKAAALEPPKAAVSNVYLLVNMETSKELGPGAKIEERARAASTRYHGLTPEGREVILHARG